MPEFSPLITTVIPTYRRPKSLRRAILSVLNQTYPNFQVCVYDDASNDETAAVVEELAKKDSRVKYFCHPQNIGSAPNYKYGMQQVETPFFSFLADDDLLLPEFYETALKELNRCPDALFFIGQTIQMTDQGQIRLVPLTSWSRYGYYDPPEGFFEMIGPGFPMITGMLFRKDVLEQAGFFDLELETIDLEYLFRLAIRFPLVTSEKPCAIYMIHPESISVSKKADFLHVDYPKIIEKISRDPNLTSQMQTKVKEALLQFYDNSTFRHGLHFVVNKNFVEAYKAADILSTYYHDTARASLLKNITMFGEKFGVAYQLLTLIQKLSKLPTKSKKSEFQEKYGNLERYLRTGLE